MSCTAYNEYYFNINLGHKQHCRLSQLLQVLGNPLSYYLSCISDIHILCDLKHRLTGHYRTLQINKIFLLLRRLRETRQF